MNFKKDSTNKELPVLRKVVLVSVFICFIISSSFSQRLAKIDNAVKTAKDLKVGAQRIEEYLPFLKDKRVAVVANQTSLIGSTHLVDSLLSLKVNLIKIFGPEHGFRGDADAGEHIKNAKDKKTGLPVISLYGKYFKPSAADLKDVDVVIFDIQDVGVRFYTFLSTLSYVMEACAENDKEFVVLDRPNPNGHYVDGPILEEKYKSYVGLHPIPIVHGMTLAEYAQMLNGEGWLKDGVKCKLKCVTVVNYLHSDFYELPVKPSPNLPNMASIYLYPSLCLFEGTIVSVGRGTDWPFQVIGHPTLQNTKFSFTPKPNAGASAPMYNGKECKGFDLRGFGNVFIKNSRQLYLYWLIGTYQNTPAAERANYFNKYFLNLCGTESLKQQIIDGKSEEEIHKSWELGLKHFKTIRKKYLLYGDFE